MSQLRALYQGLYQRLRPFAPAIAGTILFRWAAFGAMIAMCLWAERRPAPHLPDLIIDHVPYMPLVDRWNSWVLIGAYLPMSLALLFWSPARFCRYTVTTGLLSLVRGVCIMLTGLGPVHGPDLHAGMDLHSLPGAWLELMTPSGLLLRDSPHLYLTKDLFFSGHTGVTFLILLYVWPQPVLRWLMLVGHVLVVASVVLGHLHYSIDIVGAYAIAFSLFVLREGQPGRLLRA